ncbi:hypothetical protein ACH5RR_023480 [Cinchona calisaya]|uniref:Uncharacterized protein n=1 Tax=Cinchona calisaya TaxID=153742 RepID=A0ABD2ZBX8_9GENT
MISILSSIHIYWSSAFILPEKIIRKIESLVAAFLRSGEINTRYGSKVSWEDVCKLLKEGGFVLIIFNVWNKCLIMKHVWNICAKKPVYGLNGFMNICRKMLVFGG